MNEKRKKIAVIITGGSIDSRKGLLNAAIKRTMHLKRIADYDIDVYYLQLDYVPFVPSNIFCKKRFSTVDIDGCHINVLWHKWFFADNRWSRKIMKLACRITKSSLEDNGWLKKYNYKFSKYDLLSVHSSYGAYIGDNVKNKYGIPYFVTWHGSDIHTQPFCDLYAKSWTIHAMENADMNFFVSGALLDTSNKLTKRSNKMVLYNGVDKDFYKYSNDLKVEKREKFGVKNQKVVAFVGSLYPVKNADLLPDIFGLIKRNYNGDVVFWIVGDGKLRSVVEEKLKTMDVDCKIWGNQPVEMMPDIYNCIDVMVLPSKNEGLPLVTVEALACGANVVGSNAGGIPEVIGEEFCACLGDCFVDNIAEKVVDLLNNPKEQKLSKEFYWENTARKENEIYERCFVCNRIKK